MSVQVSHNALRGNNNSHEIFYTLRRKCVSNIFSLLIQINYAAIRDRYITTR